MKGLNWALYYDKYHSTTLDTADLASRISKLILDSDVQKQMGIIPYVLTGDERHLDLRCFPDDIKQTVWEKQHHICPSCKKSLIMSLWRVTILLHGVKAEEL